MKIKKIVPIVLMIAIGLAYACKKAKPNLERENSENETNLVQEQEDFGRVVGCSAPGWASFGGTCNGGSGVVTTVSNLAQLQTALNQNKKVINIASSFVITSRINITNKSDMTIYGSPGVKIKNLNTTFSNSGVFRLTDCSDMIIRNLKFEGPGAYDINGGDNLSLRNCSRIWVDHCNFEDGMDGNFDITDGSDYITVTYCKFSYLKPFIPGGNGGIQDHRFSNLVGGDNNSLVDPQKLRVTYARCWWSSGCVERMPRVRFGKVHVVNCYYNCSGNNYCVGAAKQANLRIEKCYFNGVNSPISLQTSSSVTAYQNIGSIFNNCTGTSFGTAFTPPYSISILNASSVVSNVTAGAGATLSGNICGF